MFLASNNSKNRVFHYGSCRYVKRIGSASIVWFYTAEQAKGAGFIPCSCCSIIGKQYLKEKKEVSAFCSEHGYKHFMYAGELYVISADDTAWRITYSDDKDRSRVLFHESKRNAPINRTAVPYPERDYHDQNVRKTNILGYLAYIHRHDIAEQKGKKQKEREIELRNQTSNRTASGKKTAFRKNKRKDRGLKCTSGQVRIRSKQEMETLVDDYWGFCAPAYR